MVNERFQGLFPAVFGGGRAYLELTGDNLLDSGITVMACAHRVNVTVPFTYYQVVKKALTAIALVFIDIPLKPSNVLLTRRS